MGHGLGIPARCGAVAGQDYSSRHKCHSNGRSSDRTEPRPYVRGPSLDSAARSGRILAVPVSGKELLDLRRYGGIGAEVETNGRSAVSARRQAASTSTAFSTRTPSRPIRRAKSAYGRSGRDWEGRNCGDPLSAHRPGDLVEVAVVEHRDHQPGVLPLPPVLGGGDEFGHAVHLHGAVSDDRDRGTVGMREFRADEVRHPGPMVASVPDRDPRITLSGSRASRA